MALTRKQTGVAALALLATVGLVLAAAWFFQAELAAVWRVALEFFSRREAARDFVLGFGPFAPVGFVGLQALQVIVSPIPGEATGLVGGFVFGWWMGFVYSTMGLTLGSLAAFAIARQFRRLVSRRIRTSPAYNRFENLIEHQGLFVCFFLFVFPGFPKDFLSYLLGLSRMPWQIFFVLVFLGRMPGTLLLSVQGANVYTGNLQLFLLLTAALLVLVTPAWYYRDRIYQWIEGHSLKDNSP